MKKYPFPILICLINHCIPHVSLKKYTKQILSFLLKKNSRGLGEFLCPRGRWVGKVGTRKSLELIRSTRSSCALNRQWQKAIHTLSKYPKRITMFNNKITTIILLIDQMHWCNLKFSWKIGRLSNNRSISMTYLRVLFPEYCKKILLLNILHKQLCRVTLLNSPNFQQLQSLLVDYLRLIQSKIRWWNKTRNHQHSTPIILLKIDLLRTQKQLKSSKLNKTASQLATLK